LGTSRLSAVRAVSRTRARRFSGLRRLCTAPFPQLRSFKRLTARYVGATMLCRE
jgi:hypothetical protein